MDLENHLEKVVKRREEKAITVSAKRTAKELRANDRKKRKLLRHARRRFCYLMYIPWWKRPFIHEQFTDWRRGMSPLRTWGGREGMYFTFEGHSFFVLDSDYLDVILYQTTKGWEHLTATRFFEYLKTSAIEAPKTQQQLAGSTANV